MDGAQRFHRCREACPSPGLTAYARPSRGISHAIALFADSEAIRPAECRAAKACGRPTGKTPTAKLGRRGPCCSLSKIPTSRTCPARAWRRVARERGVSPEDVAVDLVIEDGTHVGIAYTHMSEDNLLRLTAVPWISFDSDEAGEAPEGVFLLAGGHPRAPASPACSRNLCGATTRCASRRRCAN